VAESQEIHQLEYRWQTVTDMSPVAYSMSADSFRVWTQRIGVWVRHPSVDAPSESVRYETFSSGAAALAWRLRDRQATRSGEAQAGRPLISRVLVGPADVLTPDVAVAVCYTGLPAAIGPLPGTVAVGRTLPIVKGDALTTLTDETAGALDEAAAREAGLDLVVAAALGDRDTALSVQLPERHIVRSPCGNSQAALLWGLRRTVWPVLGRGGRRGWSFSTFEPPLGDMDPSALPDIVFRLSQATPQAQAMRKEIRVRPQDPAHQRPETPSAYLASLLVAAYAKLGGEELSQLITRACAGQLSVDRKFEAVYEALDARMPAVTMITDPSRLPPAADAPTTTTSAPTTTSTPPVAPTLTPPSSHPPAPDGSPFFTRPPTHDGPPIADDPPARDTPDIPPAPDMSPAPDGPVIPDRPVVPDRPAAEHQEDERPSPTAPPPPGTVFSPPAAEPPAFSRPVAGPPPGTPGPPPGTPGPPPGTPPDPAAYQPAPMPAAHQASETATYQQSAGAAYTPPAAWQMPSPPAGSQHPPAGFLSPSVPPQDSPAGPTTQSVTPPFLGTASQRADTSYRRPAEDAPPLFPGPGPGPGPQSYPEPPRPPETLSGLLAVLSQGELDPALPTLLTTNFQPTANDRAAARAMLAEHGWYADVLRLQDQVSFGDFLVAIFWYAVVPDLTEPRVADELSRWVSERDAPAQVISALYTATIGVLGSPQLLEQAIGPALAQRWRAEHRINIPWPPAAAGASAEWNAASGVRDGNTGAHGTTASPQAAGQPQHPAGHPQSLQSLMSRDVTVPVPLVLAAVVVLVLLYLLAPR
jgi:hypothetical protein